MALEALGCVYDTANDNIEHDLQRTQQNDEVLFESEARAVSIVIYELVFDVRHRIGEKW